MYRSAPLARIQSRKNPFVLIAFSRSLAFANYVEDVNRIGSMRPRDISHRVQVLSTVKGQRPSTQNNSTLGCRHDTSRQW